MATVAALAAAPAVLVAVARLAHLRMEINSPTIVRKSWKGLQTSPATKGGREVAFFFGVISWKQGVTPAPQARCSEELLAAHLSSSLGVPPNQIFYAKPDHNSYGSRNDTRRSLQNAFAGAADDAGRNRGVL